MPSPQSTSRRSPPRRRSIEDVPRAAVGAEAAVPRNTRSRSTGADRIPVPRAVDAAPPDVLSLVHPHRRAARGPTSPPSVDWWRRTPKGWLPVRSRAESLTAGLLQLRSASRSRLRPTPTAFRRASRPGHRHTLRRKDDPLRHPVADSVKSGHRVCPRGWLCSGLAASRRRRREEAPRSVRWGTRGRCRPSRP